MNARAEALAPGRARWFVPAAMFVTVLVGYLNRLNLAMAVPAMKADFGWTDQMVGRGNGQLLTAFFVGYGLTNIMLSGSAARLGIRRSLLIVIVLFSLCTVGCGMVGGSLTALLVMRLLLGVCQGVHFPLLNALTKHWFPLHERSRANGIWVSGMAVAPLAAPLLLLPLVAALGWRGMFVAVGAGGLALALPCVLGFVYDRPRQADWISEAEAAYIEAGSERDEAEHADWGFLKLGTFWLALLAGILNNICFYGIMMWLPTYLSEARGIALEHLPLAAAAPYVVALPGIVAMAWLGDALNRRALLAGFGVLAVTAAVYGASVVQDIYAVTLCFSCAVFFQTAYGVQEFPLLQRILPRGSISRGAGFYNGVAVLVGGGLSSWIIGEVIALTGGNYDAGLLVIVAATLGAAATLFALARMLHY